MKEFKTKNRLCLCVLFLVLLEASPFSFGQDPEAQSLQGLQVIDVIVEDLDSEARRTGLAAEQITTDVELQLRKVGIRIARSVSEYIYVNTNILEAANIDRFVYSLRLELYQDVTLTSDTSLSTTAATWIKGTGFCGACPSAENAAIANVVALLSASVAGRWRKGEDMANGLYRLNRSWPLGGYLHLSTAQTYGERIEYSRPHQTPASRSL